MALCGSVKNREEQGKLDSGAGRCGCGGGGGYPISSGTCGQGVYFMPITPFWCK